MKKRYEYLQGPNPVAALDMVENVISVGEFSVMSDQAFEQFAALLNDKFAVVIQQFYDECIELMNASPNSPMTWMVQQRMPAFERIVLPRVRQLTFASQIIERGCLDTLRALQLTTYRETVKDMSKTYEDLKWFLSHRDIWITRIPPRTKEDYDAFAQTVEMLPTLVSNQQRILDESNVDFEIPCYPCALQAYHENGVLFRKQHEKERSLGLDAIVNKASMLEAICHGMEYNKYCDEHGISQGYRLTLIDR